MILWYEVEKYVEVFNRKRENLDNLSYEDYLKYYRLTPSKVAKPVLPNKLKKWEWYIDATDEYITMQEQNAHY